MEFSDFTSRLENPKVRTIKGQAGVKAKCPAHNDHNPSFAAWEGMDGFIHVNCQAGCTEDQILSAMGLTQEDRRITKLENKSKPREVYEYQDKKGGYLFEKIRYYGDDGKKRFAIQVRFKDGVALRKVSTETGASRWPNIEEAGLGAKQHCLFNLPAITKQAAAGGQVLLCNGEKAAKAFNESGYVATCMSNGESSPWMPYYAEHLRGATVYLVAQRDKPGENWAKMLCRELTKAGIPCYPTNSRTEGEKDDGYEHIRAGFGVDDLIVRNDLMPDGDLRGFVWASEIEPSKPTWLFEPYFALGTVCGIEGDPGIGKSMLAAALCCVASNGARIGSLRSSANPVNCLMYMTEDAKEYTTVPRLMAFEGNLQRIALIEDPIVLDQAGLNDMKTKIRATNAKLVMIDPIQAFIDATLMSSGARVTTKMIMDGLKLIAKETMCCIVCLRHLRKSGTGPSTGGSPIYDGLGPIEIIGTFRSCIQARWDKKRRGWCNVTHVKTNLGEYGPGFSYRLYKGSDGQPRFEWLTTTDQTAESFGGWYDEETEE